MSDLFKRAAKNKYRFNYRGLCTVEDLWDLHVEELDSIYKKLTAKQKNDAAEESLLAVSTKEDKILSDKIAIIKEIVTDKLAAQERARKAAEKHAQNQRILEIMASKKDAALEALSYEELQAMLNRSHHVKNRCLRSASFMCYTYVFICG